MVRKPGKGSRKISSFQTPRVVYQPEAVEKMWAGIDRLVRLISPTLGPLPRIVAIEAVGSRTAKPELLDSGGTIAQRVIQLPDRGEDVGAMILRQVLDELQESEGDGTATAAVMFGVIFDRGRRYLTAGGNPIRLRRYLEEGMKLILSELDRQRLQLQGKEQLSRLARAICFDDEMAKMAGEIFDIIGAYGRLEVRRGSTLGLEREYVEGMYWNGGFRSREMANADHGLRANLENAAVLITDLDIDSPEQLVPVLQTVIDEGIRQVLLVSNTLSERAMGLLLARPNREKVFVVAVKTPGLTNTARQEAIEDLAVLTGGRALTKAAGDRLEAVRAQDFGRARRAWADSRSFGLSGGRGNPRALRQHIAGLRQMLHGANGDDRKRLLERLGQLIGGSAILYVGGSSPTAVEARTQLAKRTAEAMRGAIREGIAPGGGTALLNCRPALRRRLADHSADDDARAAYAILLAAVEAPFRVLAANAGFDPNRLLFELEAAGNHCVFDALTGRILNLREAGIYDSLAVVKAAVRGAVGGATLGLTAGAVVHRRNPPEQPVT